MAWLAANWIWIVTAVAGLDQVLAQIPGVSANSTFQLIDSWIKSIAAIILPKSAPLVKK